MKHVTTLCEAFDRLEAELRREHTSARVKAALAVMRSRVEAARYWMEQTGEVQREMFDDTTPKGEPAYTPYSDTGHSLDAAAKFAKSGKGNQFELDVLELLNHRPRTCDAACQWFEKREYSRTGEHISMHATVSPRFVGLKAKGHIFEDGKAKTRRDCDAGIYHISASGRERLARERKPK